MGKYKKIWNSKAEYDEYNRRVDEHLERLRALAEKARAELERKPASSSSATASGETTSIRSPFRPSPTGGKRYKKIWSSKAAYDEHNRRVDENLERLRSLAEKAQAELDRKRAAAEGS